MAVASPPGLELNDPVTQHMRRDFTQLSVDQTVGEALAGIRERPPEGRIIYFYVVDREGQLQGVVPTRRLLLSPLDQPIADIMVRKVIAIPQTATVLDACEFFTLHRLLAFPVVDEERRIIGVVDVELYTEELSDLDASQRNDDLFQLIGVHLAQAKQLSPVASFRSRFPWLLCNIGGGILAAFLSGVYQDVLGWNNAVLALFIPVVLALAEGVSIQSVSLALQLMRGQRPTLQSLFQGLGREAGTGLLLGGASALIVGLVALVWLQEARVALCLLGAITGGMIFAAVVGLSLPTLLRLLQRDPQVAAGPVALAVADMLTLLLYFNLGRWLLQ